MEKKDIIKKYKQKIKILKKHNKSYFSDDDPQISDTVIVGAMLGEAV